MSGFEGKLGRKQEAAVLALLSTKNVEEAARVAGVTPRTLYRWQNEPEFDAAYRAAKRAAYRQAIARLHHLTSAAVSTLGKVMLEAGTPASTKVRAADSILNHTLKAIENEDILARLSALERAAEESKPEKQPGRFRQN
jgi:transposase-like protein